MLRIGMVLIRRRKVKRGCARYIGRYLARPAIAEYRILSYDGKIVHFGMVIIKRRKELK
jgi:hypothetical protein